MWKVECIMEIKLIFYTHNLCSVTLASITILILFVQVEYLLYYLINYFDEW